MKQILGYEWFFVSAFRAEKTWLLSTWRDWRGVRVAFPSFQKEGGTCREQDHRCAHAAQHARTHAYISIHASDYMYIHTWLEWRWLASLSFS